MDKNYRYTIIGCIVIVLLLLVGLAYMQQGTENDTATPTPTAAPSTTAAPPAATATPGSATSPVINASTTVTITPVATPSVTPTPVPGIDPYAQPGWPYYNKQYGPVSPKGTITVHFLGWDDLTDDEIKGYIIEILKVGVLPGSYGDGSGISGIPKKIDLVDVPLPESWTPIGADGYVYLGEFDYGSYTVYCEYEESYYEWQSIVIDDSHRDWIVTFELAAR